MSQFQILIAEIWLKLLIYHIVLPGQYWLILENIDIISQVEEVWMNLV